MLYKIEKINNICNIYAKPATFLFNFILNVGNGCKFAKMNIENAIYKMNRK